MFGVLLAGSLAFGQEETPPPPTPAPADACPVSSVDEAICLDRYLAARAYTIETRNTAAEVFLGTAGPVLGLFAVFGVGLVLGRSVAP